MQLVDKARWDSHLKKQAISSISKDAETDDQKPKPMKPTLLLYQAFEKDEQADGPTDPDQVQVQPKSADDQKAEGGQAPEEDTNFMITHRKKHIESKGSFLG